MLKVIVNVIGGNVSKDYKDKIGITEVGALSMWVRSVVGKHFKVRFDPNAETAFVDERGNMVIPSPNSNMTIRDAVRLRGFCLHETSHPMYQPDIFVIMRKYPLPPGHPIGAIFNVLLDVHCETMRYKEWPGDGKALSEFAAVVGRDVYDRLSKALKDNGNVFPENFAKMCVVMIAARNAEATWNMGMLVGFDRLVNEVYTKEMRDKAIELERKFNLTKRIVDGAYSVTEWDIWDLSKEIYAWLWEKDPDEEIEQQGKGAGKGNPEKGEEPENGEPSGDPSNGPGEHGNDGDSPAEQLEEKIKIEELLFSDHYETMVGGGSGVGFDYTNYHKHASYTPIDPATFKVIEYGNKGRR